MGSWAHGQRQGWTDLARKHWERQDRSSIRNLDSKDAKSSLSPEFEVQFQTVKKKGKEHGKDLLPADPAVEEEVEGRVTY